MMGMAAGSLSSCSVGSPRFSARSATSHYAAPCRRTRAVSDQVQLLGTYEQLGPADLDAGVDFGGSWRRGWLSVEPTSGVENACVP